MRVTYTMLPREANELRFGNKGTEWCNCFGIYRGESQRRNGICICVCVASGDFPFPYAVGVCCGSTDEEEGSSVVCAAEVGD